MESKNIANIVLYKTKEGTEIVKKACIFYKDGTIKETTYAEGVAECNKLAKELNLSSKEAFTTLINNKLIHVMSGDEFKKNFDSFIPTPAKAEEPAVEAAVEEAADKALEEVGEKEEDKDFDEDIEDEELKEDEEENEEEGFLGRTWRKVKKYAPAVTALALTASLVGLLASSCSKKLKTKEGKIKNSSYSSDLGNANSSNDTAAKNIQAKDTKNNDDYNNYNVAELLSVTHNETQKSAMTAVSTFTNKFNGEFSKAYIEKNKTVRPALKYDEVVALQQAYNDYSKEQIRAIFNGSEVNAEKMTRSYKDASLQLMSAYAIETKEHQIDMSLLLNTKEGKDFYNKFHSLFMEVKAASTEEAKITKLNEFYKLVKAEYPVTKEVRTEGIAHADDYSKIESYKLAVTPMIAATEMMYQNLKTDVTLNDMEIDFMNDIGLCNYADDKFERLETITLSSVEDNTNPLFEQFKKQIEKTIVTEFGTAITDEMRELTKLDSFQKAINWHFEIVGENSYSESSSSYSYSNSYSESSTSYRTEESRVSKPITPEAKKKIDDQIAKENETAKKQAEDAASKKAKELQGVEDKKAADVKKDVENENKKLQQDIDKANEKINNNNKDTDKSNDTPVNESDFGGKVDFDNNHSDANGNLDDSVENITTDGTGAYQASDPLPDPNETGAKFDSQAGTFYGDNGYTFSGSIYEYNTSYSNEEIVDSYINNMVDSDYEEEAYQYTYSNN